MFSSAVAASHIASSRTDRARGNTLKNTTTIMTDQKYLNI